MRTGVDVRAGVDVRTGRTGVEVFYKNGFRADYPHCWCDFNHINNGIVLVRRNNQEIEAYVSWAEVVYIDNRTGHKEIVY